MSIRSVSAEEAERYTNRHSETRGYKHSAEDSAIAIDGYLFIVQRRNGFNNVILCRFGKSSHSIAEVFHCFREWLVSLGIGCIRVEGSIGRYRLLTRMFSDCPAVSEIIEGREVFYILTGGGNEG